VPPWKTPTLQAIAQHLLARRHAKQTAPALDMIRVIAGPTLDNFG
jgi:hypothetical protein